MSSVRVACALLCSIAAIGCGGRGVAGTSLGPLPAAAMCAATPVAATEVNSVASAGETNDTTCASVVHVLTWKRAAAKAACASPLDCTPACVACPDGKHHALAAWCDHGSCATADDVACMVAGSSLESCGFPSSVGTCPYKGVEHLPGDQWTDGCLSCSCGVPGSKSQGVLCFSMTACADGSADAMDADATDTDATDAAIASER